MKYFPPPLIILFFLTLNSCEEIQKSVKAEPRKGQTSFKKSQPNSDIYVLRPELDEENGKEKFKRIKEIRVKNIELEKLGYELWNFQNQNEICHACPAHLRLRLIENRNIWIKLTDELGSFGEAPMLIKAFEFNKNIYLIFNNGFTGQGIIEGSHFVYKIDQKINSASLIGNVILSYYNHSDRGGTGWKSYYKIKNDKIVFTKLGYTAKPYPNNPEKDLDDKLIFERIEIKLQ